MSDGGKGDNRRPGDEQAFSDNFDKIFGDSRPKKGSYVWCDVEKRMVPKDEYRASSSVNAPMVMNDIQPYKSMITGEMITSRSIHKSHLKQHGMVEIGNEVKAHMQQAKPEVDRKGIRRDIIDTMKRKGYL
jgi:hypothetical protein